MPFSLGAGIFSVDASFVGELKPERLRYEFFAVGLTPECRGESFEIEEQAREVPGADFNT